MATSLIEHIQSSKFGEIITTYNDGSIRVIASQVIPYRDYNSDTLAPQVGEVSANMADSIAVFEVTHEAAAKYVGKNPVNPGFNILSAEMMLRYLSWGVSSRSHFQRCCWSNCCKNGNLSHSACSSRDVDTY